MTPSWRSGGVEHHHDTPPYPVAPSPTSRHSSHNGAEVLAHVVVPRFMRLYATYLVGGPGHEGVRALLAHIPAVRPTHPHKPVAGLLDVSRMPSLAAVNAHLTWSMTPTSDAPPRACPSAPATAGIPAPRRDQQGQQGRHQAAGKETPYPPCGGWPSITWPVSCRTRCRDRTNTRHVGTQSTGYSERNSNYYR